jgi:hypothetical protein
MSQPLELPGSGVAFRVAHGVPLLLGIAMTLTLRGYQFGGGNHCVYLIEPLREVHPELLQNDWWTTHTLQYHVAFNKLTAALMRLNVVAPVFAVFYAALVVLLHVSWLRLVLRLGFDVRVYVLSVLFYYLSAGGTGLGSYMYLQDSSFLPGNVANVAMLWAVVFWIEGGPRWAAAACFALAGLFHLNYALVALAFWPLTMVFDAWRGRATRGAVVRGAAGLGVILIAALPNLVPAARVALAHVPKLPLNEFVDLYVHLRHPHHYDPLSWPMALWLSFVWPIPLAVVAYRRAKGSELGSREAELSRAAFVFLFIGGLLLIAFCFAGVVYVAEPLIQMSLFRFSIYPKLLSCVGAAAFVLDPGMMARRAVRRALIALPGLAALVVMAIRWGRAGSSAGQFVETNLAALLVFVALLATGIAYVCLERRAPAGRAHFPIPFAVCLAPSMVLLLALFHPWLGLQIALQDDADRQYLELCAWARDHTPKDAVFIVPPNEQLFRYHARRAIVVNFKNVPQLSSEMREWKQRLEAILDQPLAALPKRFDKAHAAIAVRYDGLSGEHLAAVARQYGARYLVTARALPGRGAVFENDSYHLYDLSISPRDVRANRGRTEGD